MGLLRDGMALATVRIPPFRAGRPELVGARYRPWSWPAFVMSWSAQRHPPLIVRVLNGALYSTHRPRALSSGLVFRESAR